jgi:hypothetical protein
VASQPSLTLVNGSVSYLSTGAREREGGRLASHAKVAHRVARSGSPFLFPNTRSSGAVRVTRWRCVFSAAPVMPAGQHMRRENIPVAVLRGQLERGQC